MAEASTAVQPVSLFCELPNEILLLIFDFVAEAKPTIAGRRILRDADENVEQLVTLLLAPLRINRHMRKLLSGHPRYWRLLASSLGVIGPHRREYQEVLELCDFYSNQTLDSLSFKPMAYKGRAKDEHPACLIRLSRCVKIATASQSTLKTLDLLAPFTLDSCQCSECAKIQWKIKAIEPHSQYRYDDPYDVPSDFESDGESYPSAGMVIPLIDSDGSPSSEDSDEESDIESHRQMIQSLAWDGDVYLSSAAASFALLSQASELETLTFKVDSWPRHPNASNFLAAPTRLQFSADHWVGDFDRGARTVCRHLGRRLEILSLNYDEKEWRNRRSDEDYDSEDDETNYDADAALLYKILWSCSASSLRHLDIRLLRSHFHATAFAQSSLCQLESLAVRLIVGRHETPPSFPLSGDRCDMPSLTTVLTSGAFLNLIKTGSVRQAGLVVRSIADAEALARSLAEWNDLETLAMYFGPRWYGHSVLQELLPDDEGDQLRCPALVNLAIYRGNPSWYVFKSIENLPRQWDWRQVPKCPSDHSGEAVISSSLSDLVARRLRLSDSSAGLPKCVAIEEIRTSGLRVPRTIRKLLRFTASPFEFQYLNRPYLSEYWDDGHSTTTDWAHGEAQGDQSAAEGNETITARCVSSLPSEELGSKSLVENLLESSASTSERRREDSLSLANDSKKQRTE